MLPFRSFRPQRSVSPAGWRGGPLLGLLLLVLTGCSSLAGFMGDARVGDTETRQEALLEIEHVIRDNPPGRASTVKTREQLDAFLAERFDAEPDSSLRSQILSMAVQGRFECAEEMLRKAVRNPDARLVRLVALQHLRDLDVDQYQGSLVAVLATERDRLVLIEAIKTVACAEPAPDEVDGWVFPLIDLYLDTMLDRNVRLQAHRAMVALSGVEIPKEDVDGWKKWRDSRTP